MRDHAVLSSARASVAILANLRGHLTDAENADHRNLLLPEDAATNTPIEKSATALFRQFCGVCDSANERDGSYSALSTVAGREFFVFLEFSDNFWQSWKPRPIS